ncbi:hypothetical protein BPAE_0021g00320 [Botrytis paeoniae]|uniref:Uncharacterized protein n=1 Tax=Botrytis paeoniae TaxID=278948 RepID=A0A4Z1G1K3_9HELO|nr:hypothetical protein BPAE_0021g00320 [Botrytis paeoniae]
MAGVNNRDHNLKIVEGRHLSIEVYRISKNHKIDNPNEATSLFQPSGLVVESVLDGVIVLSRDWDLDTLDSVNRNHVRGVPLDTVDTVCVDLVIGIDCDGESSEVAANCGLEGSIVEG